MFNPLVDSSNSLDAVAHVIQLAVTPVFLLSGIGTLLSVFSTRLGRVADQLDKFQDVQMKGGDEALARQVVLLQRRLIALDVAVVAAAVGGWATCGATIAMFIGALRDAVLAGVLFALFGAGLVCTLVALCAFLAEMLVSSAGVRVRLDLERMSIEG